MERDERKIQPEKRLLVFLAHLMTVVVVDDGCLFRIYLLYVSTSGEQQAVFHGSP